MTKKKVRKIGRPLMSPAELTNKRDALKAELETLRAERKSTPKYKRSEKQRKRIVNLASHVNKMNRRINEGTWS